MTSQTDQSRNDPPGVAVSGRGPLLAPPEVRGYHLIAHERIPLRRVTVLGLVSLPLWLMLFTALSTLVGGESSFAFTFDLVSLLVGLVVLAVGMPVVHEAIHGLVAVAVGARPTFGVGPGYAYTTFREPVSRNAYYLIGLAPLIVISLAGLINMAFFNVRAGWTLLFLTFNAAGAAGDLWMAWRLRTLPAQAKIYDLADGYAAYLPDRSG